MTSLPQLMIASRWGKPLQAVPLLCHRSSFSHERPTLTFDVFLWQPKNSFKNQKPKARHAAEKTPRTKGQTIAELRQQLAESLLREEAKDAKLQERDRQLNEAFEQQTATSEILRVIGSSPTKLQSVLDDLLANAVKLSGATKGHIR